MSQEDRTPEDTEPDATSQDDERTAAEHDAEELGDLDVDEDAEEVRGGPDRHGPMRT